MVTFTHPIIVPQRRHVSADEIVEAQCRFQYNKIDRTTLAKNDVCYVAPTEWYYWIWPTFICTVFVVSVLMFLIKLFTPEKNYLYEEELLKSRRRKESLIKLDELEKKYERK